MALNFLKNNEYNRNACGIKKTSPWMLAFASMTEKRGGALGEHSSSQSSLGERFFSLSSLGEGRSPETRGSIKHTIRLITTLCLTLMISTITLADDTIKTCANGAGIVITGNNGTDYCMSNNNMNWWTALAWCQTIGKTAIRYPEDCSCVGENCLKVQCPNFANMKKAWRIWTATPCDKDGSGQACAYDIETSVSGVIRQWPRTGSERAVCY